MGTYKTLPDGSVSLGDACKEARNAVLRACKTSGAFTPPHVHLLASIWVS